MLSMQNLKKDDLVLNSQASEKSLSGFCTRKMEDLKFVLNHKANFR